MELVPGDYISDCIAFAGAYKPALTRRIGEAARQGGTLVDIGANLGLFCTAMDSKQAVQQVYCV